jgi:transposase
MPTITDEIRGLIVSNFKNGRSIVDIASALSCSRFQVSRAVSAWLKEGRIMGKKKGGQKQKLLTERHINYILDLVDEDCTLTLKQIQTSLHANHDILVSLTTISKELKAFSYSFKRVAYSPEQRNTTDVIDKRHDYVQTLCRIIALDQSPILFLDETGFKVSMRAVYGRAPLNTTPQKKVKTLNSKNLSMSCCIMKDRLVYYEVSEQAYNSERYGRYLTALFETLRQQQIQNCVFVLDNVPFHRSEVVRNTFSAFGHRVIFLPPYSPFLNPIEEAFSKIKTIVRREEPQNIGDLLEKIRSAASRITVQDFLGFYDHMRQFFDPCLEKEIIQ